MTATRYDRPVEHRTSSMANDYPHLRTVLALGCIAAIVYFVVVTFRWPMIWDETVMHYGNFLMAHGMAPYRNIYDMNLPGIYLIDGWQMHLFGPGDLAFRMYEFFLLGSLLAAMIAIALPYDWLAGLVADAVFILYHAGDGPRNAGQRDEIITVFVMIGYVLLFQAVRRKQPALLVPFGICAGFAMAVKPTVGPWVLVLSIMGLYVFYKQGEALIRCVLYGLTGLLIPVAIVLHFLLHFRAVAALLDLSARQTPYYAGLMKEPVLQLVRNSLSLQMTVAVIMAVVIALVGREWIKNWERWAILLGVAGGFFSYVIQRKGYQYHIYPFLAFTSLWVCMEFTRAIRSQQWTRWVGFAGLMFSALCLIPLCLPIQPTDPSSVAFTRNLEFDLTQLGGDKLQHRVQCLDMVDGCLGALYHLNLVQSTGFTGDTLFFVRDHAPAVEYYRGIFLDEIHKAPPEVFVVSDEWFNWQRGFNKIYNWPAFADFLNQNYTLSDTRKFNESSYRIYVLKSPRSS